MAFLPMEINPEMMNKLLTKFGVGPEMKLADILGFEREYLKSYLPKPCAVLLLFPLSPEHKEFRKSQACEQKDKKPDDKVYFIIQTKENSCALVGLIHAVANNKDKMTFDKDSVLKDFLDKTADASPEERAKLLEENEPLKSDYNAIAAEGQCRPTEGVHFHLVVFTAVNGRLYELDGLTAKPIDHGPTSEETLLEDAGKICKQFTEREKDDVHFSSVALVKA
ncbi:ubiquitin carboxyl-terminal hydrolase isozyme L1 isoform X2 [Dendropsophus ebraccatus]|uniref:ubiquitin carboxyl-terminal hydrolase isozyme L1 isoform X2 n=1 Tax=Dendropsophus ebraccatus TaxID=150705 RepID=UPI003831B9CF